MLKVMRVEVLCHLQGDPGYLLVLGGELLNVVKEEKTSRLARWTRYYPPAGWSIEIGIGDLFAMRR